MNVPRTADFPGRLRHFSRARLLGALAAGAFLVAIVPIVRLLLANQASTVTVSAGNSEGLPMLRRMSLDGEVPGGGLRAKPVVTEGSLEMLERVDRGELDFAFVQGGFDIDRFRNVRQVAGLNVIPLILLVKEEYHEAVLADLAGLRGKSVNLGSGRRTGTYWLSRELLAFAGLGPDDYRASHLNILELLRESHRETLPDAVFLVTRPPSALIRHLAVAHRYRLVPLPYGDAFRAQAMASPAVTPAEGIVVRKENIADAVVPAFSYAVSPAIPPRDLTTVGSRLLLVTHRKTRPATVIRVLETLFASRWANAVQPRVEKGLLHLPPEVALHPGAVEFRDRDRPLITGESVGLISNTLQILIPVTGGLLFLRGWIGDRRSAGRGRRFDQLLAQVSEVERRGFALRRAGTFDGEAFQGLHRELSEIKRSAFESVARHETGAETFAAILLAHISDTRASLGELQRRTGHPGEVVTGPSGLGVRPETEMPDA